MANIIQIGGIPQTSPLGNAIGTSLALVNTPLIYTFKSKELNGSTSKSYSIIAPTGSNFSGTGDCENGDTVTIFGIILTAVDSPSNSSEFASGTTTFQKEVANSLANAINENINLNWRLSANAYLEPNDGTWMVRVDARYGGTQFNILNNQTLNFANHSGFFGGTGSVDNTRGQQLQAYQYKCYIDLFEVDLDSGNEIFISTFEKSYKSDNIFNFNIADTLRSLLDYWEPEPWKLNQGSIAYQNFTKLDGHLAGYRVKFGEQFIGGYDPSTDLPTDNDQDIQNYYPRKFVEGVTDVQLATFGAEYLNNNLPNTSKFYNTPISLFTSAEELIYRKVLCDAPFFISFFNNYLEGANLRIRAQTFDVGGNLIINKLTSPQRVDDVGVYTVSLSDETLNYGDIQPYYTTITIEKSGSFNNNFNRISKKYTIEWDLNADHADVERVYFRNKYGVIEQFDFTLVEESINTDIDEYSRNISLESGNNRTQGIDNVLSKDSQNEVTLVASNVDKQYYDFLNDFVNAIDHYRLSTVSDYSNIDVTGTNLYISGDYGTFESPTVGHTRTNGMDFLLGIGTSEARTGNQSMALTSASSLFDTTTTISANVDITVNPNTIYTWTAWIFVESGWSSFDQGGRVRLHTDGQSYTTISEQTYKFESDDRGVWRKIELVFDTSNQTTPTTFTPQITFPEIIASDGATIFFDDITLTTSQNIITDEQEYLEKWILTEQNLTNNTNDDTFDLEITLRSSIKNNTLQR